MPFYFSCPFCLHKTLVSEELSGKAGPCVNCGKQVTITAPRSPRRLDQTLGTYSSNPPNSPTSSPSSNASSTSIANDAASITRNAASTVESGAQVSAASPALPVSLPNVAERKRSRIWAKVAVYTVIAFPIIVVAFWLVQPAIVGLKTRRDLAVCQQNLRRIAKALNAYADNAGTYPPAVTYDTYGRPMHSWRVLILPYLGERKLYESYDLSKPWDAPENTHLSAQMPAVFACPDDKRQTVGETSYMLITGPGTLFPGGKNGSSVTAKAIPDGAANTLLVVETNYSSQSWTEPIDLDVRTMPAQVGLLNGITGGHASGASVVFANGSPGWLPTDISKQVLDGLITPAGGEVVQGSWFTE